VGSAETVKWRKSVSRMQSVRSVAGIDCAVACSCCVAEMIESGEERRGVRRARTVNACLL
jgi:hypothetical protein